MSESVIIDIPGSALSGDDWPTYEKDAIIVPGKTIYCFDFQDANCWPSQGNAAAGSTIKNLVDGGVDGVTGSSMTFSGGGFNLTTDSMQRIALPDACKLAPENEGFLACLWFKPDTQTQVGTHLFGWTYNNNGQYGIQTPTGNTHRIIADGKNSYTRGINGTRTQAVMGRVKVGSDFYAKVWVNGEEVYSALSGATCAQPTTPPELAVIGDGGSDRGNLTSPNWWIGKIYRSWMMDTTGWSGDVYDLVMTDWLLNKDRIV